MASTARLKLPLSDLASASIASRAQASTRVAACTSDAVMTTASPPAAAVTGWIGRIPDTQSLTGRGHRGRPRSAPENFGPQAKIVPNHSDYDALGCGIQARAMHA
jgi:hypothetical protein